MFGFLKHYGIGKLGDAQEALTEAIVTLDSEGATEAAISQLEEIVDSATVEVAKARIDYDKELAEYVAAQKLYDQRIAAAEKIQEKMAAEPENASLEVSLANLLEMLEEHAPEVQREKDEAELAKQLLDQLEMAAKDAASQLKSARKDFMKAKNEMKSAKLQEDMAKKRSDQAAAAAGVRGKLDGLSTAMGAMNRAAEKSKARAAGANLKADLLTPTTITDDPNIAEAMGEASGTTTMSASERLAALKNKAA